MPRLALTILVALLAFGASGVSALVVTEPCAIAERGEADDAACPPLCVTCGCCTQAAEPAALHIASLSDAPLADIEASVPPVPTTEARDILHVPKIRLA